MENKQSVYVYCITRQCGCFDFITSSGRPFCKSELAELEAKPCPICKKKNQAKKENENGTND